MSLPITHSLILRSFSMMMMLPKRRLFLYLPHDHLLLLRLLCSATTAITIENPSPKTHFMVEYLINSCGFSPDKAIKASTHLTHLKSTQKPESVIHFLKQHGFTNTHIGSLVPSRPRLLCANVEKTLQPKIKSLQELGFSGSQLVELISSNPTTLCVRNVRPRIEFWRSLLGTNETLLKALKRHYGLLHCDLAKKVLPNLFLLRECVVREDRIVVVALSNRRLLTCKHDILKVLVERTEQFGFTRGSGMFLYALLAVSAMRKDTFQAKSKLLKSFGWSEDVFLSAFRKAPNIMILSEKNIRASMTFLLEEVGCEAAYVAAHPLLLMFSLERRLVPRHRVLRILMSKGLPGGRYDLLSFMTVPNKKFVKRFVLPHLDKVPQLDEAYADACTSLIPI